MQSKEHSYGLRGFRDRSRNEGKQKLPEGFTPPKGKWWGGRGSQQTTTAALRPQPPCPWSRRPTQDRHRSRLALGAGARPGLAPAVPCEQQRRAALSSHRDQVTLVIGLWSLQTEGAGREGLDVAG